MKYFKQTIKQLFLVVTLSLLATSAHANLIVNGSFEDNTFADNTWRLFNQDDVLGWQSPNRIELWRSPFLGVRADDGQNLLELNSTTNATLYQNFTTLAGQWYHLTFAYRARASANEVFMVDLIDNITNNDILNTSFDDHIVGQWSQASLRFQAASNETQLAFTATRGTTLTVGNLLDDINIQAQPLARLSAVQVPTPNTLLLFTLPLVALVARRAKRNKA